jgi:hypothetical protein
MSTLPDAVAAALHDGIGSVDGAGRIAAANAALADLLAVAGGPRGAAADLAGLGLPGDDLAALRAHEPVALRVDGRHWSLRLVAANGSEWLIATETTTGEHARSAALELARLRALAGAAGAIVHDFNNMLNATLGLLAQVRPYVTDPLDLQLLADLGQGTQQGAQLARTIARLLGRTDAERALVPAAAIVDEALALTTKTAAQRGAKITVERGGANAVVRTVVAEAVQALWHVLAALVDRAPQQLVVTTTATTASFGDGRPRPCVCVRIATGTLVRGQAAELARFAAGAPGLLQASPRAPAAVGLPLAAFALRRLGGDLVARLAGEELQVDCLLPAVP